jgi:hypothetical protein
MLMRYYKVEVGVTNKMMNDEFYEIIKDPIVGRTLLLKRDSVPGEVLWVEKSFVFAMDSCDDWEKYQLDIFEAVYSKSILKNLSVDVQTISNFDNIESLDTAKNLVVLAAITLMRKKNILELFHILSKYYLCSTLSELEEKFALIDQLSDAHFEQYADNVKQIKSTFPNLFPKSFSIHEISKFIGILNSSQLELDMGGSGLFPWTAIVEHSCDPNCSFTTHNNNLYFTTIKNVRSGDRLTIDYGNNYYHNTKDRIETLNSTYGFICRCTLCTGLDKKRPYICQICQTGIILPNVNNNNAVSDCGHPVSPEYFQTCISREQYLNVNFNKIDILKEFENEIYLSRYHYLRYWALDEKVLNLIDIAQSERSRTNQTESISSYPEAKKLLNEMCILLEWQLPPVHHEKVIIYDRLAQVCVGTGDIQIARDMYYKSYINSCLASGADTPPTQAIWLLYENTPQSLDELYHRYNT